MEKEKKGIKCSYALLVVVLFAALAFTVDYAVIERKIYKCNCPKCESIIKNEVISDNKDNTQVTEKQYTYKDTSGHYRYSDDSGSTDYYFYENGTMILYYEDSSLKSEGYRGGSGGYLGYYTIENDKIKTGILFEYYDETEKLYYKPSSLYSGANNFEILDINELYSLGGSDKKYQRVSDEYFDSDQFVEKIVNSEIIYGSELNNGEPRS